MSTEALKRLNIFFIQAGCVPMEVLPCDSECAKSCECQEGEFRAESCDKFQSCDKGFWKSTFCDPGLVHTGDQGNMSLY